MLARDIMTPGPSVARRDTPIRDVAEIMEKEDVGILPVVDDPAAMHLVGVITDRDIVMRCVARGHGSGCTAGDHMTRADLQTVPADTEMDEVVALMERYQLRRIPVLAADGTLAGIISQADVAIHLGDAQPGAAAGMLRRVSTPAPRRDVREVW